LYFVTNVTNENEILALSKLLFTHPHRSPVGFTVGGDLIVASLFEATPEINFAFVV